jgi:hypothetical protein
MSFAIIHERRRLRNQTTGISIPDCPEHHHRLGSWKKWYNYALLSTTPTLNHNGHQGQSYHSGPFIPNKFSTHRWIHIAVAWGYDDENGVAPDLYRRIYAMIARSPTIITAGIIAIQGRMVSRSLMRFMMR